MVIRATDDEQLARSLWGDDCVWDDNRAQYVPQARPKTIIEVADAGTVFVPLDYSSLKVPELQAELAARNERRTGEGLEPLPTNGRKSDMVASLARDDTERQA